MVKKHRRVQTRTVHRAEELVQASERRAKVVALVNQSQGPLRLAQIAEHLGWDAKTTSNTMRSLHGSGLIVENSGSGRGNPITYSGLGSAALAPAAEPAPPTESALGAGALVATGKVKQLAPVKRANGHGAVIEQGVELVIGGITATFSRNAKTGRPRVTIEY